LNYFEQAGSENQKSLFLETNETSLKNTAQRIKEKYKEFREGERERTNTVPEAVIVIN